MKKGEKCVVCGAPSSTCELVVEGLPKPLCDICFEFVDTVAHGLELGHTMGPPGIDFYGTVDEYNDLLNEVNRRRDDAMRGRALRRSMAPPDMEVQAKIDGLVESVEFLLSKAIAGIIYLEREDDDEILVVIREKLAEAYDALVSRGMP